MQGRRKHRTDYVYGGRSTAQKNRRCGECEGCTREDCSRCDPCQDKPKFGGRGLKKQACVYRLCSFKNPGGTPRGRGAAKRAAVAATLSGTPVSPKTMREAAARARQEEEDQRDRKDEAEKQGGKKSPSKKTTIKEKAAAAAAAAAAAKRGRQSLPVVSPSSVPKKGKPSK